MRGCAWSWVMAIAGLGLVAACERPVGPTQPPPGDPVVQIVSSPTSVTLDPYQTQQFLAYGRTQAGDSVAVVASWSASGGTITSGGLYAADTNAGTYQVTATAQVAATAPAAATPTNTRPSGSSTVKNTGPLTQVILTPATASVLVGGTLQFAAYGRRKNGDSTSVSVVYAATGGTHGRGHRGVRARGDDHGDERDEEQHCRRHGHERSRSIGDGDSGIRESPGRRHSAIHRRDQRRGREYAHRSDCDVGEQQHRR